MGAESGRLRWTAQPGSNPSFTCALTTLTRGASSAVPGFRGWKGLRTSTAKGFKVYHWMSPDIKVRRPSLGGPTIGTPPTFLDFSANIGDYIDTSHAETADDACTNRIFIQVHNRALTALPGNDVRVLLLLTDAHGLACRPCPWTTPPASPPATPLIGLQARLGASPTPDAEHPTCNWRRRGADVAGRNLRR